MAKITAMHSGGDWYDASAEYLILPDGLDVAATELKWQHWYNTEYKGRLDETKYVSLIDWLKALGAREPTDDELEIYEH